MGPTNINYLIFFSKFFVYLSLQMEEMEVIVNGEDLDSKFTYTFARVLIEFKLS